MISQFENETRTNMDLFGLLNWKDDAIQSCNKYYKYVNKFYAFSYAAIFHYSLVNETNINTHFFHHQFGAIHLVLHCKEYPYSLYVTKGIKKKRIYTLKATKMLAVNARIIKFSLFLMNDSLT